MTTLESLLQVQALIGDPEHPERWTKGCFARDQFKRQIFSTSRRARSWSIHGAISKFVTYASVNFWIIHDRILGQTPIASLAVFNDAPSTTHADICDLIQRAIDAERAKEADKRNWEISAGGEGW